MTVPTPIGQLDYRLPQAGRIRTGQKVSARSGKMAPKALKHFRFTSGERSLLEPLAERYGGTIKPFNEPGSGDKWMVDTNANVIDVIVPVPKAYTLSYELWHPHLIRRCNGNTCELLQDTPDGSEIVERPCICAQEGELECSAKMRVSLLLPNMPTLGTWRWDTSSDNAVKEIRGVIKALHDWVGAGLHPCKMRIEERRQPSKVFKVVVLDPGISVESLVAGDARLVQLPAPSSPAVAALGAGASSVTRPTSTPEAGEPMAGGARGDDRTAPDDSPLASPSTDIYKTYAEVPLTPELQDDARFAQQAFFPTPGVTDDDIVDAEVVDEPIPHIDEAMCQVWKERLTKPERNKLLREARPVAVAMGEPVPTTFDSITLPVIDRFMQMEAGDDARVRTSSD